LVARKTRKTIKSKKGRTSPKKVKRAKAAKPAIAKKAKTIRHLKAKIKKPERPKAKPKEKKAIKAIKEIQKAPEIDYSLVTKRVIAILSDCHTRQMLIEIGGENALAIVRNFYGNQSDEELAKKLKIKISDVRATLNKLHNEGLVNYIREKDSETGWYSYSWSLNHERMERWATSQASRFSFGGESGTDYYFCPSCGTASITNFESAAGCEFRCERCNKLLEYIDEKGITELFEKKK